MGPWLVRCHMKNVAKGYAFPRKMVKALHCRANLETISWHLFDLQGREETVHINQYIWYLAYLGYHKNSLWKQQHFCICAEDYLYFYAYKVPVGHSQLIVRSAIMETNYGSYKEIEHPERWRSATLGQPTSQQAEFVPDSGHLWVWLLSYWLSLPELLDWLGKAGRNPPRIDSLDSFAPVCLGCPDQIFVTLTPLHRKDKMVSG